LTIEGLAVFDSLNASGGLKGQDCHAGFFHLDQWQWSTGTDELRSTSFFQLDSPNGTSLPSSLQGESYARNFLVAISVLVSRTSEAVFQLRGVSQSSPVAASARQNIFM